MVSKKRSPNYPAIDLGKAVERTRQLYETLEQGGFTQVDAAHAWGYKSDNGISRSTIGALRQYGLIVYKKGDQGWLTDRGLTIVLSDPSSAEFHRCVRDAALEPPLFGELFNSGRANSARDALRRFLVMEKAFTNDGAARLIEVLNATKSLISDGDNQGEIGQGNGVTQESLYQDANAEPQRSADNSNKGAASIDSSPRNSSDAPNSLDRTRIPLRLVGGFDAEILLPTDMTDSAWQHLLQYLQVMKGAYVREPEEVQDNVISDSSNYANSENQETTIAEIE